jgi:hypothetical protein
MINLKLIGTVAIAASALASPALAQEVIPNPGKCAQYYPNANCQNYGPGNPYEQRGYYPGAGAWNNSYNRWDDSGYARCARGTWFIGADGRRHPCQ